MCTACTCLGRGQAVDRTHGDARKGNVDPFLANPIIPWKTRQMESTSVVNGLFPFFCWCTRARGCGPYSCFFEVEGTQHAASERGIISVPESWSASLGADGVFLELDGCRGVPQIMQELCFCLLRKVQESHAHSFVFLGFAFGFGFGFGVGFGLLGSCFGLFGEGCGCGLGMGWDCGCLLDRVLRCSYISGERSTSSSISSCSSSSSNRSSKETVLFNAMAGILDKSNGTRRPTTSGCPSANSSILPLVLRLLG